MAVRPNHDQAETFRRILALEQTRGHDDKSVYGGLDRYLARWKAADAAHQMLRRLADGRLLDRSYADLSTSSRSHWVAGALAALGPAAPTGDKRPAKSRQQQGISEPLSPDQPAMALRSVTARVASPLRRLGVETLGDLLYLFPRRHNEIRKIALLSPDEEQTTVATIWEARKVQLGRSMKATEAVVGDDTGNVRVVWYNQPYLAQRLKPGAQYVLSGRVSTYRGHRVLDSPHHEELRPASGLEQLVRPGRLFPVYPLTEGITQQSLRRTIREALARGADAVEESLPGDILGRNGFLSVRQALWQAHYPDSRETYDAARRRLAFEELFLLQLRVLSHRRAVESGAGGIALRPAPEVMKAFLGSLPFQLTVGQRRVMDEVLADLGSGDRPMSRLLQGEVGSGKTVVALAALLVAAACGYQGGIMAPTEILAEQHFLTISRLLSGLARPMEEEYLLSMYLDPYPRPITVGLLLGSMTAGRKREMHRLLADGALDVAIGTHALIQEGVDIPRLALAVVDEQHRFGVLQRAALRQRGERPHLLVMSATPIPRTLALTLYGDLDISTLDELPPGRQQIRTRVASPARRTAIYDFIRKEVEAGRQAFIVYPLIDESESVNARAAIKERDRLAREVLPDLRIGLLHGRMAMREKQEAMEQFRRGDLDILVSTPVVEVGVDVPNATVMLIEGADRFGLAQLHQFRGRVGRGQHASYCILVAEAPSEEAQERLSAMEEIDDGFRLAEVDLQLRGPGDYFGTRQSGLPDLRMARVTDTELLALARQEAQALLDRDPELAAPEHGPLRHAMARLAAPVDGEVG